jgi:hypothetical protein
LEQPERELRSGGIDEYCGFFGFYYLHIDRFAERAAGNLSHNTDRNKVREPFISKVSAVRRCAERNPKAKLPSKRREHVKQAA